MKDYPAALTEFKKVSSQSDYHKEATLHIGFILRQQEKIDEGLSFSSNALNKFPQVAEFYDMKASFLEGKKKFKEALATLSQGVKRFGNNEKLLYFQGAIFEKLGEREKAIANMRLILTINPENAHALNFLGYTLTETGKNLDEAEKHIRKAKELKPDDGFIEDSLGWVLFKQGKESEGLAHLEKAVIANPDEGIILDHLGDVYSKMGRGIDATATYKKAAESCAKRKDAELGKKVQAKLKKLEDTQKNSVVASEAKQSP
jgi:tetratricopeptide (TPR) repeat protein